MLTKAEVFERHGIELTRFATSLVGLPTVNSLGLTIANKMLLQMGWIDGN
jgi:hypothetical protein